MAISTNPVPQHRIAIAQTRASRNIMEHRESVLKQYDLTSPEWFVLGFVGSTTKTGGVKVSDIAAELDVQSTYVTGILRKLEAKDLIELRMGESDRRVRIITASKKGLNLFKTIEKDLTKQGNAWLHKTSDAAYRNYLHVLETFSQGLPHESTR